MKDWSAAEVERVFAALVDWREQFQEQKNKVGGGAAVLFLCEPRGVFHYIRFDGLRARYTHPLYRVVSEPTVLIVIRRLGLGFG